MKLEYLDNISDGGKYTDVVTDTLVRLYGFDNFQANEFCQAINKTLLVDKKSFALKELSFIRLQRRYRPKTKLFLSDCEPK